MKVFIILLVSIAMSLASLEPSDYRPPGSSHQISSDLYLPPSRYSGSIPRGIQTPESHYLPSNHQTPSQNVLPNSLYLPTNHEQTHTSSATLTSDLLTNQYLSPSNQYLPSSSSSSSVKQPTNQYLPPSTGQSIPFDTQIKMNKRQQTLSNNHQKNLQNTYRRQSSSSSTTTTVDNLNLTKNKFAYNRMNNRNNNNNLPSQYLPPSQNTETLTQEIPSSSYLPANQNQYHSEIINQPSDFIVPPSNTYLMPNKFEMSGGYSSSSSHQDRHNDVHLSSSSMSQYSGHHYPNSGYQQTNNNNNNNNNDNNKGYNYEKPAKYDFEYIVNDPDSNNDFGHKESRDGDVVHGSYFVLLSNGKKQKVSYIADANGYRPTITYEDADAGRAGYNQGYHY